MEKIRDFDFTDKDFKKVRTLVKSHTGISLSNAKKDMVYSRLSRRLRALKIDHFSDYCSLVEGGDGDELIKFTNAITTNLTAFFREDHHFQHLAKTLIPALTKSNSDKRIRIWSAGCSTGEEPYSLAIAMKEAIPSVDSWDVKILATDLDSDVLNTAKNGVYKSDRIDSLSSGRKKKWFLKGKGDNAGTVRVRPELQDLITFKQLNLLREWPTKGPFDFIFCRNVVIYFDKETQKALFNRYANVLKNDAHLFIGHSESLFKVSDRFSLLGQTIYKKIK
ncbi:MAG: protein-glutamate O-methyltransferase CheR [Thiotrichaceae bacterium]|nr:protein-glutamate O-methyltransferase CheR [Thiotrichaceae bacterium]PCI15099.1 MAG: chemotaxis protein CheR [Thiotrichales bacterium]